MKGLRTNAPWGGAPNGSDEPREFVKLFDAVLPELDRLFWLLNVQSGPFSITAEDEFERLESELDCYWIEVPEGSLWRPGVLSRFGRFLVEDEDSYLVGVNGPEASAREAVAQVSGFGRLDRTVFERLSAVADVFITTYAATEPPLLTWEIYSTDENLLDRLTRRREWTKIEH